MSNNSNKNKILEELGLENKTFSQILGSYRSLIRAIYGQDIDTGPGSFDGEWIRVIAEVQADMTQKISNIWNQLNPDYATDEALDRICAYNGIQRRSATNGFVELEITGEQGTIINNGIVQDENGNNWLLPEVVEISDETQDPTITVTATATAQETGNITAGANTINEIMTIVSGWQSVTNPEPATPGTNIETDAQLRFRRTRSVAKSAQNTVDSIFAEIGNIDGVEKTKVYENDTNTQDANGIPGHTIEVVVKAADEPELLQEIGETIRVKKSPGCGTHGNKVVTIQFNGNENDYFFSLAEEKTVEIEIDIEERSNFVSQTLVDIKEALVNYVDGLQISEDLSGSSLYGVITGADPKPFNLATFKLQDVKINLEGELVESEIEAGYRDILVTNIDKITINIA